MRSDARRNREKLIAATEAILTETKSPATMPTVAKRAGLSTATAYRYFPSLNDLLDEFLLGVVVRLRNFSHDCTSLGSWIYVEVVDEWVRLLQAHGPGMIQARSRQGYLQRLTNHDPVITTVRDAWERPVRAVLRERSIPDQYFEHALFLHNSLFDPREVLDLLNYGLGPDEAKARLIAAFYGAIQGWAEPRILF